MSVAIRTATRIQDQDDAPSLGAGQDGYALTWNNATGAFVATALFSGGLLATGATTGATAQAQTFTSGISIGSGWSADDTMVNVKRAITGAINSHGYRDESAHTPGGSSTGYGSFDAQFTMAGAQSYDHFAGFQSRPEFLGSGTITKHVGFWSLPEHSGAGTISALSHFRAVNVTGGGTVTNQYGLYIESLTGGTNNYAIYTAGTTTSFFGGLLWTNSNFRVDGLASFGNVAANTAYQVYVASTLDATKTTGCAVLASAPVNVSTGTTYGAFFSNAAVNNTLASVGTNFIHGFTARAVVQAESANSAVRYMYAASVKASASAGAGYTAQGLGAYGLLVDSFTATGAGTISFGGTAGIVINNQGNAKSTNGYGLKIEDQSGSSANYAIYTGAGDVRLGGIVTFAATMSNSAKDPTSDAPADWVQIKIGSTTYYLPAYAAS